MPLAPIDAKGSHFLYQDTGVPAHSTDYTTLVVIHGTAFYSENFKPMFARANEHGMRIVLVTLRDYPGSTTYTSDELSVVFSQDAKRQADFMQQRSQEIAAFLVWLIQQENLPPISEVGGKASGGIAVLGWSSGSSFVLSLVANADKLAPDDRDFLASYLRICILWDPPTYAVGCPLPSLEDFYCLIRDPALAPEEIAESFPPWVSSYYAHDPAALNSIEDLSFSELVSGLKEHPITDPPSHQRPTVLTYTIEQFNENIDMLGAMRSHLPFLSMDRSVFDLNARHAVESAVWPRLKIGLVWCDMSVGDTVLGAWYAIQLSKQAESARPFTAIRLRGANHFPHWNEPKRSIEVVLGLLRGERTNNVASV
ncbi:hypothetical protein CERSUDRAFT_88392 [Gelatoporia subvermispora B]|uniref:AB hydrolase-1 domain-containing protein n=1 Tax=Ceriporiopsis subvermispora (strain B) TaxID=914234 RepID=M2QJ31_CERS8|nr:hypothetical protein CERSUDRAFT_88392 [Gelatoporia subvermispora B]